MKIREFQTSSIFIGNQSNFQIFDKIFPMNADFGSESSN